MRVRLGKGCLFGKMSTPYGIITHEWTIVPDDAYVYAELEVEGRLEQNPVEQQKTPIENAKPIIELKPAKKRK